MFWRVSMDKGEIIKKTNIEKTHVPDKVYAFMIQSHHMLYELLNCKDGDSVSVEVFDDVGVEHVDGSKEAIQLKSALSNRNPVSNKATDLWKTMYNWLISVEVGLFKPENVKFILFLNVNKQGSIVNGFHLAKNYDEAVLAWENAKKEFYDEKGEIKEIGEEYKKYVEYFFSQDSKEIACKIIQKFELKKCIDNYSLTVRKEFDKSGIPADIIDPIYMGIIGWIDVNVTKMVENNEAIIISFEKYQMQLRALYRDYNQKHSLMTHSVKPSNLEIQRELQQQRTYIAQLEIIDCDYTEKIEAINDFLRASIDRTIWADNGEISFQSMQTYEEKLKRSWNLERKIIMIERKNELPEEQGKLVYYKCQQNQIEMQSVSVPEFFQNGCYHLLADELEVGWHPHYLEKIKGENN